LKHAGADSLRSLSALLDDLRSLGSLVEKKPGVFYRKSRACLHFHEDPAGLFADLRITGAEFVRYPVNTRQEQRDLLDHIRASLRDSR
jgi:hypothetical protein